MRQAVVGPAVGAGVGGGPGTGDEGGPGTGGAGCPGAGAGDGSLGAGGVGRPGSGWPGAGAGLGSPGTGTGCPGAGCPGAGSSGTGTGWSGAGSLWSVGTPRIPPTLSLARSMCSEYLPPVLASRTSPTLSRPWRACSGWPWMKSFTLSNSPPSLLMGHTPVVDVAGAERNPSPGGLSAPRVDSTAQPAAATRPAARRGILPSARRATFEWLRT